MKKAILFGASGFIGSYLLTELLGSERYSEVIVVVRKPLEIQHPKLKMLIGDFHSLTSLRDQLVADDVFLTLGTTRKAIPNQSEYYQIDHDYPVLAAKIARERGATSVFVVTAVGANANSDIFYTRTKGEIERDILTLQFKHTHIFRPSMLLGERKENRPLEKLFLKLWPLVNPIFRGPFSNYRGIEGRDVALAMVRASENQTEKVKIYHWNEMILRS